jgi:hypothetical protein
MSDFHTWNELQEDTTGRSAYTNAAPYRSRHGRCGSDVRGLTRPAVPYRALNPWTDRHPGLLRLYVCTLVGGMQRIAASEKFEHAGAPCSG